MNLLWLVACAMAPEPEPVVVGEPGASRLVRLTHQQWEATAVDLLHLPGPTGFLATLLPDPATSLFENDASGLAVTPTLWLQYQAAPEVLAEQVVSDPELFASVTAGQEGAAWVQGFARRAYRRPATPQELLALTEMYTRGEDIFGSGDPLADGVRAVIVAVMQSPSFLYRTEGLAGTSPELEAHELAAKLSYALWNTMPDDALLDAADAGLGPPELAAQVDRMLADPKAHEMIADLHRQLLEVDNYGHIYRSDTKMAYEDSLPWSMEQEVYTFVDRVVFTGGTVTDLLTSRQTTVDERVAEIYGVTGVPEGGTLDITLDPAERSGLLTLSGFLAMKAGATQENLISRGGFVHDRFLCQQIPAPPSGVPPLPEDQEGRTLRQRVEDHTTECGGGCHAPALNALGFAFTGYDETGRVQTLDQGQPIDATSSFVFEEGERAFDGVVELASALAEAPEVHRCYASHLLSWVEARPETDADDARLAELATASRAGRPILELLRDLVTDEAFRLDPL